LAVSDYYSHTSYPTTGAQGSSAAARAEFEAIENGISAKLPDLTGNGGELVAVNAGGTAMEAVTTTGTGSAVRATSPTLVTPILGTPTSGDLQNCTALPVGSVTGMGTGVGTFLATPSSANLRAALTDETGSGAAVFATAPTLSGAKLDAAVTSTVAAVGALDIDCSAGTSFSKTIAGDSLFAFTNPPASGIEYTGKLTLTHTSGAITWPASVEWPGDVEPAWETGKVHLIWFSTTNGGTTWRLTAAANYNA
jgi:hypothetical protein